MSYEKQLRLQKNKCAVKAKKNERVKWKGKRELRPERLQRRNDHNETKELRLEAKIRGKKELEWRK